MVDWRYIVQLDKPLGGLSELEFDGKKTWPLQEQGREDA
jgi:hypothetical protein